MIGTIPQLREYLIGTTKTTTNPHMMPELFYFLGNTKKEQASNLAKKVIGGESEKTQFLRKERQRMFEYIIDFWKRSLLEIPYMAYSYRGVNLAHRPFLSPSAPEDKQAYGFFEQYRWDTYFQNHGLLLAGGHEIVVDQLLNLADVFTTFKRIPNALTSSYLSHAQPPFEALALRDAIAHGVAPGEWSKEVIEAIKGDLLIEWWDLESGRIHKRQTQELVDTYGFMTRYTPIHHHPLLASCEDGKDHNWITVEYGSNYLPVQLNSLIYSMLDTLVWYYQQEQLGNDPQQAELFQTFKERFVRDFQQTFWQESGKWQGFRNYSMRTGEEGRILYGDLSAEIFPLFVGIATPQQAEVTKNNLDRYYRGGFGLATTSLELRTGGTIEHEPASPVGWKWQWEYPNCWPPLMFIAVEGLKRYGYQKEALQYEVAWVRHIEDVFEELGSFPEKTSYNTAVGVEPGLYGTVKGFGWTIGVYLSFLKDLGDNKKLGGRAALNGGGMVI